MDIGDVNFETFDFDSLATTNNFIDRGAFGDVYGPFTWKSRKCALKKIWISVGKPGDLNMKVEAKRNIWTSMKHKNLLEIHNHVLQPKALYIVMEFASGGSLRRLLDSSDVNHQIPVSDWARQIAEGMLYLHDRDVVHRDLKSGNILLMDQFDSLDSHKDVTLKITDFDEVKEHAHTTTMSFRGTYGYMAPEILMTERFSKASDIWSYGVVIWEMLTSDVPHKGQGVGPLMVQAQSGQLTLSTPESIPTLYKKLLRDCLCHDTKRRPPFRKIIDQLNIIDSRGEEAGRREPEEMELKRKIAGMGLQPELEEQRRLLGLIATIRTKAAEEERKGIYGLTMLDKELFVVSEKSSNVEVYDSMKFSLSRRWNLKELIAPVDIASCNRNKCLYISDFKGSRQSNEILRVDPNGELIEQWSTKGDWGRLSVTYESNVILTVVNENKLNEYSPDGDPIRETNLSSEEGFRNLNHAIKLTNGHFVVSQGYVADDLHRICIVDADGQLLRSFGGSLGSTIEQLNFPAYVFVDGNGFVLVADRMNSRVLILDPDLELKREILSKEEKYGLRHPMRALLDESNGRLLLADCELDSETGMFVDGQILIFDFK